MVTIKNLTVALKNNTILRNISCTLTMGRITTFLGKSGAGKTTLLKTIAGLIEKTSGEILINGKELDILDGQKRSETVGYVFQDFNLFTHMTVKQNCIDPQLVHGRSAQEAEERAMKLLQEFGIAEHADKYPSELSGGQQQRVAIARALCLDAQVLLLDEPTASLDPINTEILTKILQQLANKGLTIALSSQDMNFVKSIFDRVYYLDAGTITEFCDKQTDVAQTCCIKNFL
jgi:ABC-type polar amino acid transport system ATPase subunit